MSPEKKVPDQIFSKLTEKDGLDFNPVNANKIILMYANRLHELLAIIFNLPKNLSKSQIYQILASGEGKEKNHVSAMKIKHEGDTKKGTHSNGRNHHH